jgi:NAD(P)-dependent dehydrogenase (short-subunit alcohol dehydrogenase family)
MSWPTSARKRTGGRSNAPRSDRFGDFDTSVDDAGISIYGNLLDISTADLHRLIDTNVWGVVYGSLEAARYFRGRQGPHARAIINLGSEVSDRSLPVQGFTPLRSTLARASQTPCAWSWRRPGYQPR